ncbi:hypothetical protein [Pseudobacteriovorax antillogorgiicola]|uniref:Uncharacterized protein n=1 Tax=Pseudobacteriovorax antillogorgiicola TaxID=1513793 RepID=A0A1Y6CRV5_9BACT|nr:hypothetical protein [Pseudobacteriovorax antillogorgiicola]TCS41183.1 hypothetical protein EDD56_15012 [Pseudobacteriovorax antillogorgiicola]SMF83868.1 hypothetical protein SAMN06296036_1502 [Pseudobacteriovorax antillogorgiicola]
MRLKPVKNQEAVQALIHKFEQWRNKRIRGKRLPEDLWQQTVLLARKYPPNHVARAMTLDPRQLKKRMGAAKD